MYGALPVEGAVYFRTILPPAHVTLRPDTGMLAIASFILTALRPLQVDLDLALARDDRPAALALAYRALLSVADALAAHTGCVLHSGEARVHALLVELEPLSCVARADGTLDEQGAQLTVYYRNWRLAAAEANLWADELSREFQARWPDARFVMSGSQGVSWET